MSGWHLVDDVAHVIGWLVLASGVLLGVLALLAELAGKLLVRAGRCPVCWRGRVRDEDGWHRCELCGVMPVVD